MQSGSIEPGRYSLPLAQQLSLPLINADSKDEVSLPQDQFTRSEKTGRKEPEAKAVMVDVGGKEIKLALDPHKTIEEAIAYLSNTLNAAGWVRSGLDNADRDISYAERELNRADFPLSRVERDDGKTDVSSEGYTLDRIFYDAKRETRDAGRDLDDADRHIDTSANNLAASFKKVEDLEKDLSQDTEKYKTVLEYLGKAKSQINSAYSSSGSVDRKVEDASREVDNADRELMWTSSYTSEVKSDRPGKDVSSAGRRLKSISDRTEWNLRDADSEVNFARMDLSGVEINASRAIETLRKAKTELGQ